LFTSLYKQHCGRRCRGSALIAWAARACSDAALRRVAGGGHVRFLSGDVLWCSRCGAYATSRVFGLARACPGRPSGSGRLPCPCFFVVCTRSLGFRCRLLSLRPAFLLRVSCRRRALSLFAASRPPPLPRLASPPSLPAFVLASWCHRRPWTLSGLTLRFNV
jgi:hypothetical protein